MKRTLAIIALVLLGVTASYTDPQIPAPAGNTITMTGSAIRLVPNPSTANPVMCASILLQPLAGGSAVIYVLNAQPSITMARDGAGTTTVAQLGPGTATQPGQSFTFPSNGPATTQAGGTDLRYWGVVGTASDQILASCDKK